MSLVVRTWGEFPNFNPATDRNIRCQCGKCGEPLVSLDFMRILQRGRTKHRRPANITSGCRCKAHNTAVKGAKNSDHLYDPKGKRLTCGFDIAFVFSSADKVFTGQLKQARDDSARWILLIALLDTTTNNTPIVAFLRDYTISGINRIGVSYKRNFVHLGVNEQNPANVCWFY